MVVGALDYSYACVALGDAFVVLREIFGLFDGKSCAIGVVIEEESLLEKEANFLAWFPSSMT